MIIVYDSIAKAIDLRYPLMGFSYWHHQVAKFLGYSAMGCNAVIVYKGESIVISGDTFEETEYFRPQVVAIEPSHNFPKGVKRKLEPYTKPHEIATIIKEIV